MIHPKPRRNGREARGNAPPKPWGPARPVEQPKGHAADTQRVRYRTRSRGSHTRGPVGPRLPLFREVVPT